MSAVAELQHRIAAAWLGIAGSKYAGIAVGVDGEPDGHLVLLADKPPKELSWDDAVAWAKSLGDGARLPTREESALLYANLRSEFESGWHWTGTQYSSGNAWLQYFSNGFQNSTSKKFEARARAVRRFNPSVLQSFAGSPANLRDEAISTALLRQILDEIKGQRSDFNTAFLADIEVAMR